MPPRPHLAAILPTFRLRRATRFLLGLMALTVPLACRTAGPSSAPASVTSGAPAGAIAGGERLPALFSDNYVFLRGSIGGHPVLLLFDSGAGSMVLSQGLVARLGLAPRGQRVTFGLGTTAVQASVHAGMPVQIGSVVLRPTDILTWPDTDLPSLGAERAQGIVGAELLHARIVEVNWQEEALLSWDTSAVVPPRLLDESVRLDVVHSLPVVTLRTHARGRNDSLRVVLDYGSSGSLILDGNAEVARGIISNLREIRTRRVIGVGGSVDGPEGRLDSLTIGRQVMRFPLAFVDTSGVRTVSLAGAQGLVGTELLRRVSIVLDYRRELAILRPTRRLQFPFCRNASGVCFERTVTSNAPRVAYLEPRSPAGRSGLAVGDVLLAIDGIPVSELTDRDIDARFDLTGAMHTVEVRRGSQNHTRPTSPTRGRPTSRPPITVIVRWRL
jgi:hypothetical protein